MERVESRTAGGARMTSRASQRSYRQIEGAEFDGTWLIVRFANGDVGQVAPGAALGQLAADVDWRTLEWEATHLSALTSEGVVELPWDSLRALTDSQFARGMADEAEAHARRI